MDSFYEQPRTAPIPTCTEKIPAIPVVPEVSMIFQNNSKGNCDNSDSIYLSYNAWKARNQSENAAKRNYCPNSSQQLQSNRVSPPYLTKQVRFESPVALQQRHKFPPSVDATKCITAPCFNNPHVPHRLENSVKENVKDTSLPGKPNLFTKPFEQIYMANIPNRHLDLSIIEPLRPAPGLKKNLENISPNVNLGINGLHSVQQNVEQSTRNNKNYVSTSKDVCQSPRIDHFSVNKNKFNDYQYPEKLDRCFPQNIQYKKGIDCDLQKISDSNKSDPLEKNRVIDLYNYKRGGFEAPTTAYGHRQTLDNLEFANNYNMVETPVATQTQHTRPNNCLYDSFDSHNCENGKHICSCNNSNEFQRSNVALQAETVPVPSNPGKNSNLDVVNKSSDEPTVKDLLKIIHQQNDQLLVLQKQVTALLSNRDAPKQIEAPPAADRNINVFGEKCRTSTQLETQQGGLCNPMQKCLPRKGPLPQFSLDVMTSFEVSIRRQQNLNRAYKDAITHQPKICEVTETDSNTFDQSRNTNANNVENVLYGICNRPKFGDDSEVSLTLNEPVHVRETCPTPENTVRIDMEDYSSDSDEENSSDERWFYKNVQGQVNQILRKSGIWNGPSSDVSETCNDIISQNIRKKVKEATVKHLKSIGVHVPTLDNSDDVIQTDSANNVAYNPKEVSFAVKQLLMKYLPNEQLAKVACNIQTQNIAAQQSEPTGLIKRRPEFSFATVQYMQKYNLLTDVPNARKTNRQFQASPGIRQDENFDRILDVTAIKQQPKLL